MNEIFSILSYFGIGILLAFTPCMLPMMPIISNIVIGQNKISLLRSGLLSLSYVLGMSIVYALAGLFAALAGDSIQNYIQVPSVIIGMGLLLAILSLSSFGLYELALPSGLTNLINLKMNKISGGTFIGTFLMGGLSSLIVSPCISAPLAAILTRIAETGKIAQGTIDLFSMGLGMGLPLILISLSLGKILPKTGNWMTKIKFIFGILMLITSAMMIYRGIRLL